MSKTLEDLEEDFKTARGARDPMSIDAVAEAADLIDTDAARGLSLLARADAMMLRGSYADAEELLVKALEIFKSIGDEEKQGGALNGMGIVLSETGKYTRALEAFHQCLEVSERLGLKGSLGAVTNNMGSIFSGTGDNPTALEYFMRALALHKEVDNKYNVANTTQNIGDIYASTGEIEKGLEFLRQGFDLQQQQGNKGYAAGACSQIGKYTAELGDMEEAEKWFSRGIDIAKDSGDTTSLANVFLGQAFFFHKTKRYEDALQVLADNEDIIALQPSMQTGSKTLRAKIYLAKQDLATAKELLEQALDEVTSRNERKEMANLHKDLRDIAKQNGDLDGYISHNEDYQSLSDEISGASSARKMAMQDKERELANERREREREREILYGALPQHVADRLIKGEDVADNYDSASVLFLDIVGFTRIASSIPAGHVVHLLESIFGVCDEICALHGVTKIKTIGDSYMAVAGVPDEQGDHVVRAAKAATEIQSALTVLRLKMPEELGDTSWTKDIGEVHARVGLHCGAVVAGVVGKKRLQYDVWGDAVNVSSRMESSGEPGRVQVSDDFQKELSSLSSEFTILPRVAQEIKGKGLMQTFWIEPAK